MYNPGSVFVSLAGFNFVENAEAFIPGIYRVLFNAIKTGKRIVITDFCVDGIINTPTVATLEQMPAPFDGIRCEMASTAFTVGSNDVVREGIKYIASPVICRSIFFVTKFPKSETET